MPRSAGTYTLPAGNPVVSGTVITTAWANPTMADIATALTQSLARDGQTVPTANLPMAGFKLTNVGKAAAANEYARADQVQDGSLLRCSGEANTGDAYTGVLPFAATAFVNGQTIVYKFPAANTTTAPTLNINSSAAWPILRQDGSAVQPGDCVSGVPSYLTWNDTAWLLLGVRPASATLTGVSSFNTRTGAVVLTSADVATALTYTPANKAGETFTGPVMLAGDASVALGAVTLQQMLTQIASIPTSGPFYALDGSSSAPAYSFAAEHGLGMYRGGAGALGFAYDGNPTFVIAPVFNFIGAAPSLSYAFYAPGFAAIDAGIGRNAAGVIEANSGVPTSVGGLLRDFIARTSTVNDSSAKRFLDTAVVQTPSATPDFTVNQTITFTLTGALSISNAPLGLPNEGNQGLLIFKNTAAGAVTWSGANYHFPNGIAPDLTTGPQKLATVTVQRIGTTYYCRANVF